MFVNSLIRFNPADGSSPRIHILCLVCAAFQKVFTKNTHTHTIYSNTELICIDLYLKEGDIVTEGLKQNVKCTLLLD